MQPTEEAAVLPGHIRALPVIITVVLVIVIVAFNLLHETGDRDGCGDGNHRLRADDHDEVDQPPPEREPHERVCATSAASGSQQDSLLREGTLDAQSPDKRMSVYDRELGMFLKRWPISRPLSSSVLLCSVR